MIDQNKMWIYRDFFHPDGKVQRFRLEWLYHNTHSTTVENYIHEPGFEYLNENLDILSIAIHTSIWDRVNDRPREYDYHGLWREVDYEDISETYP